MELWPAWMEVALYFTIAILLLYFAIRRRQQRFLAAVTLASSVVLFCFATFCALDDLDRSDDYLSPNGTYIARVIVGVGPFLSSKETRVTVRPRHQLTWLTAYSGDGWSRGGGEASHHLEWTDDTHLVIHYHGLFTKPCPSKLGAVYIECRSHIW